MGTPPPFIKRHDLEGAPLPGIASQALAVELSLPKKDVAPLLGPTLESLSRALHRLHKTGILDPHGATIVIMVPSALGQAAESLRIAARAQPNLPKHISRQTQRSAKKYTGLHWITAKYIKVQ
ncbi:TPA: helix-turn-helix domain-containing protein [Corynebacterium striatum]|uniref:helix-turn-helix domain-containing protein n=1 Tax=Corynebacterium striatum TaxID=43770 RepID=UPI0009F53845|nr:hypothetical protein [Corynebacterium striatum]EGT5591246.1 hypothetical protein [Corynebacterium striatum]EGT5595472.1 hypothetical protein [Corynebacterium striatum]EGT5786510.1 hypothetical protein [Corynebacterium striatum]HAT1275674.1 helix-turn-helix domain-containing protein [Corynebacterium striatum]